MPPLNTIVMLIHLGAGSIPLSLPDVMPKPLPIETCRALQQNTAALAALTEKAKTVDPRVERTVVGCHRFDRDNARLLGQSLLDGNL